MTILVWDISFGNLKKNTISHTIYEISVWNFVFAYNLTKKKIWQNYEAIFKIWLIFKFTHTFPHVIYTDKYLLKTQKNTPRTEKKLNDAYFINL